MILSELPCNAGRVRVEGTVSYASQDPWLFVGSVRQNILFGQPFVKSRYMQVCKVCALERDISLFPHGDKTVVGERGVSLSGGQRARINLARAVYKEADIYLLDDPLSAVDTHVAKHIFEKCIKKYLEKKTVILVTHQLQFIKQVDQIIIMDKGNMLAEGEFEALSAQELEIIQLIKEKTREVHEEPGQPILTTASIMAASTMSLHRHHWSLVLESSFAANICSYDGEEPGQPILTTASIMAASTMSLHRHHWSLVLESSFADQKPEAEMQTIGRVHGAVYRDYFLTGAACSYVALVCCPYGSIVNHPSSCRTRSPKRSCRR
ncbi:ABC transporter domain-containing protein [Phthorimaea operculella]|nr:ABC transporter domain-containing protein [Phthorimaea operculella]